MLETSHNRCCCHCGSRRLTSLFWWMSTICQEKESIRMRRGMCRSRSVKWSADVWQRNSRSLDFGLADFGLANITAFLCSVLESVSVTLNGQNSVSCAGFFWYPTIFHLFHLVKPLHNCSVMQSQTKTVDRDIWFNERCFDTWRASLMFFSWKLALLDQLTHSQCMNVNKVNAIDHFPPYFQVPTCARWLTKFIFSILSCACTRRCNRRWPYWFMIPLWSSSCSKIFFFCLFAYVPLSMELCSASVAPDARTQSLHVSLS